MTKLLRTTLFAISILSATVLEAATYYTATTGNDSNPGSQSQPFRTIAKAISALAPGDTLYIRGGTYGESVNGNNQTIPVGTSWSNALRIAGYPGETVILNPATCEIVNLPSLTQYIILESLVLDGANQPALASTSCNGIGVGGKYVRLRDLEVKNAPWNGIQASGSFHEFINLKVHDNGRISKSQYGPGSNGGYLVISNSVIDGGEWYNNQKWGIRVFNSEASPNADNNIVRNAKVYGNGWQPDHLYGGGIVLADSNNSAYNNIVYNNNGPGISAGCCKATTNARVYNNTIYGNADFGIQIASASMTSIVRNNIVYSNAGNIQNLGNGTVLQNNLTTDPKFINASGGDFRLGSSSLAIDAGADLTADGIVVDISGSSRPYGCCFDVGAFEYGSSAPALVATAPATASTITVDSSYSGYTTTGIDDGVINATGGVATTWASADSASDHWVDIVFPSSRTINTATIYWAYNGAQKKYMTSQKVLIQYWDGSAYQTAGTINYPGSNVSLSSVSFPEVSTSRLRFYQPANQGNPSYTGVLWISEVDYGLMQPGVTVDSTYSGYASAVVDDGVINATGGVATTWASADSASDHWVNIVFPSSRTINTVTIYWAYNGVQKKYMTSQKVLIQYWDGSAYQTAGTTNYPASDVPSSSVAFPDVHTFQLRFYQPANQGNPSYPGVFWLTELDYGLNQPPLPPGILLVTGP